MTNKTSFKMNRSTMAVLSLLLLAVPAAAQDVAAQQAVLSNKLDSIEAAKRGFSIYGNFESKASVATADGDLVDDQRGTRENDAFTRADLSFEFRASEEFRAVVDLRVH